MAMIWVDGFDNSSTLSVLSSRYSQTIGGSSITGRIGGYGVGVFNGAATNIYKAVLPSHATYIVHVSVKKGGASGSTQSPIITFLSNNVIVGQVCVVNATSAFVYNRIDASATVVQLGTSSSSVEPAQDVWYHLQAKVTINSSTGAVHVKVNNNSVINVTSVNTQSSHTSAATGSVDGLILGSTTNFASPPYGNAPEQQTSWRDVDDFVLLDGSGATNNDFLGDIRVQRITPTANGTSNDFTPTGAATNWQANSETNADGDTSYSSTGTTTHKQLFAMGNLTGSPTIHAVQARSYAKKTDAGTANITPLWRSGGTTYSGTLQNLSASYIWHTEIKEQDPNTAAAWTASGVNALESGVEFTT